MRKTALSLFMVLLASLPVAAQNFLNQAQEVIQWLDSVAYQDSILIASGKADGVVTDRLNPCDCNPVISLFEIETGRSWADAREILWDQGYILQCGTGMSRIPGSDLSMANIFVFKIVDTTKVHANDYIIPGLQELSGDNDVTVYIVDPVIIPFGKRGNFPAGMATVGPDGQIVPYVFSSDTKTMPGVFAQVAFWRHLVQNQIWKTSELRPSFMIHRRQGSIEWMKDTFDLAEEWGSFLNEISAANHAQLTANEVSHVISERKWSADIPCPMSQDIHRAFEALSDATSLETLAKRGDIHFFALFAVNYFNRVANSGGHAGYTESERIARETGEWLLGQLSGRLLADEQTEWWEDFALIRVQRSEDLIGAFLDLYFLFDDGAYRRYVVEPFAAHYGELTLERLAELGININKR